MNKIQFFFFKLNQAYQLKQKFFIIQKTPLLNCIIQKLFIENFIYGSKYIKETNQIVIYLKYSITLKPVLSYIAHYKQFFIYQKITYKQLLSVHNIPYIFLIWTSKGLITQQEAILNKIGGKLICILL